MKRLLLAVVASSIGCTLPTLPGTSDNVVNATVTNLQGTQAKGSTAKLTIVTGGVNGW